jgi:glycosyltransferase involved in cell wall biosynthesis
VPRALPCPVVATFHDATPLRFLSPPEWWPRRRACRAILSIARATLVHAVSQHARDEAVAHAGVAAERVRVAHWGVGPPFRPAPAPVAPEHLLYVGGADPHKNLDLLLAMLQLPAAAVLPPVLVAGPAASDELFSAKIAATGLAERVRFAVAPDDDALADLYQRALALLVPSRNEGFGLPMLEAMACGCPVLAAAAGALPEVGGEAAALLSPNHPQPWLDAAMRLHAEPTWREKLAAAGLAHARAFTWRRTAEALLAVYGEARRAASARR